MIGTLFSSPWKTGFKWLFRCQKLLTPGLRLISLHLNLILEECVKQFAGIMEKQIQFNPALQAKTKN